MRECILYSKKIHILKFHRNFNFSNPSLISSRKDKIIILPSASNIFQASINSTPIEPKSENGTEKSGPRMEGYNSSCCQRCPQGMKEQVDGTRLSTRTTVPSPDRHNALLQV